MTTRIRSTARQPKSLLASLRAEQRRYERWNTEAGRWLVEAVRRLADEVEFTGATTRAEHEARVEEFNATARPTW